MTKKLISVAARKAKTSINSKNKGSNWERKIAKKISLWISNGDDDSLVWRTSSSGARATQRSKQGKQTQGASGDLTFTDEKAAPFFNMFSVELKIGYSDTNILLEIDSDSKKHSFRSNLDQCINDANLCNKEPFLIFKRDRMSPCVCFLNSRFNDMKDYCGELGKNIKFIKLWDSNLYFVIMELDVFLNWINPGYFK